mgnify:CR=1 FL=1
MSKMNVFKHIMTIVAATTVFCCCGSDHEATPDPGPDEPQEQPYNPALRKFSDNETMNVLFIGNSLTADAVEHLPRIFKDMGIRNVNLYAVYRGAFTLPRYAEVFDEPNSCALFSCEAGHDDWDVWDVKQDDCLKDIIGLRAWDVVSIQEHTGAEQAWDWTDTEETAIKTLVDRFNAAHPDHHPTTAYLISHVYGNVFYKDHVLWDKFDGDNNKMWETCIKVIGPLKERIPITTIIPCATAVQNLRTSKLNWTHPLDMSRDGVHSDKGITRFCEAATVFQTIFKPCLGRDISDCTYIYDVENTDRGSLCTPVTEENRGIAIQAANDAVKEPARVTRLAEPKPEDETVNYTLALCGYHSVLTSGLNAGNGTMSMPAAGMPSDVLWDITAVRNDTWAKEADGTLAGYEKGIIDGSANHRLKMGTASNTLSKFVLRTTNLSEKVITNISVGLSTASKGMTGKVSIKVGDTDIVTGKDIALSTAAVKDTGFIYGADCNATGEVEISVHDLAATKTVFYLYDVSVTYRNK